MIAPFRVALIGLAVALCAPAAFGQMPQPDTSQLLSSSDVSDEQVQKAARIVVEVRLATRSDRMKMQKEMQAKYGNPQEMDSTQKAQAQREMRRRRMKIQKKQMKIMQKAANEENLSPQRFQRLMRSVQQDSTLEQRFQTAIKAEMKKRQGQMNQSQNPPNQ